MGNNIKRFCSICVRSGSKGLPNKNIRPLLGMPLFAHSINQAKKTELFDYVAVSSDSDEILEISKSYGSDITIKRPKNLALDKSPKLPVIQHCFMQAEKMLNEKFDIIIDLDATSPLRSKDDILNVLKLLEACDKDINIITGSTAKKSPYFNLVEIDKKGFVFLSGVKRQWKEMTVDLNENIKSAINILSKNNQIVFVLDNEQKLKGTITDKDIKTGLMKGESLDSKSLNFMNPNPKYVYDSADEEEIYNVFKTTDFMHLPVLNTEKKLLNVRNILSVTRRQDSPTCYDLNASIYGWWRKGLVNSKNVITERTRLFEMPPERSVDIDSELDFKWVEFLMKNN